MPDDRLGHLVADPQTGLSELIGSWKIMAMSRPRTSRIAGSLNAIRSSPPSNGRERGSMPSGGVSRRRMARAVTLLPQPDSPTRQSVRPCATANETLSTTVTSPNAVARRTVSSSMRSSSAAAPAGVDCNVPSA
jgi:hypothetical protein